MPRPVSPDYAPDASDETVEALEQRVRRLEDAVAALQDTHLMEDRVVERVVQRMDHLPYPPLPEPPGLLVSAARMLLPKTVEAVPGDEPPANPPGADPAGPPGPAPAAARPAWLLTEVVREFRAMFRMLMDYRYRMSWTGRVVLPAAISIAVLSWWLLSGNFFGVGTLIDRTVDVVLAVVVYKVLSREVQRYHELLARVYRYR
jgi:hypothetical protein